MWRFTRSSTKEPKEQPDKHGAQKNPDTSIQRSSSSAEGSSSLGSKKLIPGHNPAHVNVVTPVTVSTTAGATGTAKVCIVLLPCQYRSGVNFLLSFQYCMHAQN